MPNTAAAAAEALDSTEKRLLLIYVDVVDKPEIHVDVYSTPPGLNRDDTDHIVVSLNKAHPGVASALAQTDITEIQRMINFTLIHDRGRWQHHCPLHLIRRHIWKEAGKTDEEMASQPGFFDIAYKPSPLLKRVADLPIFGDKAELAQYDAPHLLGEIDITETKLERALRLRLAASTPAPGKGEQNL